MGAKSPSPPNVFAFWLGLFGTLIGIGCWLLTGIQPFLYLTAVNTVCAMFVFPYIFRDPYLEHGKSRIR